MSFLIVLGASVRALAFSAVRAGFQPLAFDLFADRDLAALCPAVRLSQYPRDFITALATTPNVPWMYTGGLENYPHLINQLAKMRPLLGNSGSAVRAARDPVLFGQIVSEAGLHFPGIGQASDTHPQLLKLRRSSGGLGVRLATPDERQQPPDGAYLQQFVDGKSWSAVFLAADDQAAMLGLTRQWNGRDFGLPRPFLYVGNVGPVLLPQRDLEQLRNLGHEVSRKFHLRGLFNVDLIRNEHGLWALEINPRYSASVEILERAWNGPAVQLHVDACQGQLPGPLIPASNARLFGKAVVYARQDGIVPKTLEHIANEWNVDPSCPGLADLPHTGESIHAGQPVVTVFAEGASVEQVEQEIRRRAALVQKALQIE